MEITLQENIEELEKFVIDLNNKLLPFLDAVDLDTTIESVSEAKNSLERWIEIQNAKVQTIKTRITYITNSLIIPAPIQELHNKENDPSTV